MSLALASLAASAGCQDSPLPAAVPGVPTPLPPSPRAHLHGLKGQVTVKRAAGDEWVRAGDGMPLFTGDKVATGAGARAQLRFLVGGQVTLGENALVGLPEPHARPGHAPSDVTVLQGRVDAELAQPHQQSLSVETPEATVRAGREVVFQ